MSSHRYLQHWRVCVVNQCWIFCGIEPLLFLVLSCDVAFDCIIIRLIVHCLYRKGSPNLLPTDATFFSSGRKKNFQLGMVSFTKVNFRLWYNYLGCHDYIVSSPFWDSKKSKHHISHNNSRGGWCLCWFYTKVARHMETFLGPEIHPGDSPGFCWEFWSCEWRRVTKISREPGSPNVRGWRGVQSPQSI